jgi:hypothetical protein
MTTFHFDGAIIHTAAVLYRDTVTAAGDGKAAADAD